MIPRSRNRDPGTRWGGEFAVVRTSQNRDAGHGVSGVQMRKTAGAKVADSRERGKLWIGGGGMELIEEGCAGLAHLLL